MKVPSLHCFADLQVVRATSLLPQLLDSVRNHANGGLQRNLRSSRLSRVKRGSNRSEGAGGCRLL